MKTQPLRIVAPDRSVEMVRLPFSWRARIGLGVGLGCIGGLVAAVLIDTWLVVVAVAGVCLAAGLAVSSVNAMSSKSRWPVIWQRRNS